MRAEVEQALRPDLRGQQAYGAPQIDVPVRLNTNENSYPVPAEAARAIAQAVEAVAAGLNRYPDREFTGLRTDLAGYLGRQTGVSLVPQQIWAANGSNEVLQHLLLAFGGPGRTALGFTPAYSMHPIISRSVGTRWVDGLRGTGSGDPQQAFDLDAESAAAQVREHRPDVVFLCSPNNPTGTALTLEVVEAVLDAARWEDKAAVVIVDEAYAEFSRPGTPSATTLLADHPLLVVSRTMSKAFALAGARVGYLAADADLVEALRLVRLPYHLSDPTQAVARAALAHTDALLGTVEAIKGQRDRMVEQLAAMGYPPVPSDANFVLFGGLADAHATWEALLEAGVLIRDVGIAHYLRVSAGTPEETDAFLRAMAALGDEHRLRPDERATQDHEKERG